MEKESWQESEKRPADNTNSKKRKGQKKENASAREGKQVAKHCVFPMFCASGGSKSGFAKAVGAEPSGEMRDQKLHAIVARTDLKITKLKLHAQNNFGSGGVEKVNALEARNTSGSKNVKNTSMWECFLMLKCPTKNTPLKALKTLHVRTAFGNSSAVFAAAGVAQVLECWTNSQSQLLVSPRGQGTNQTAHQRP